MSTIHCYIPSLTGEKGDAGGRGPYGKLGKSGQTGPRGPHGVKGTKGSIGSPGEACKSYYAAFSVGRKKALHSNDYYQTMIYDTEFVNLYGHFNMFTGKFFCYVPGIYFFSLNAHTWNQKETYLHVMKNEQEMAVLYAQPSDRSIMQSQSLMLELERDDQVWVRLYKGERENAVFSDDFDTYITFSGHLIKAKSEGWAEQKWWTAKIYVTCIKCNFLLLFFVLHGTWGETYYLTLWSSLVCLTI